MNEKKRAAATALAFNSESCAAAAGGVFIFKCLESGVLLLLACQSEYSGLTQPAAALGDAH
jgi:hypothetical protein